MSFGQDFLKGFYGADGLKDYAHASKTFLTNGYELAPRTKFLFHVYFTINTSVPALRAVFGNTDVATVGLLVKTVQLPNYTIQVDTLNQYNRKRLVQSKIEYNPVTVEFHDDGGDVIRNMWYNYFAYYYKDPSQKYDNVTNQNGSAGPMIGTPAGFNYNSRDIYDNSRTVNDWGYIGEAFNDGVQFPPSGLSNVGKPPFFRDIRIYGLNQHNFAEYVLINPMITEWQHDTYDYSQGNGMMTHRMTMKYETVKYYSGAIGGARPDTNVVGFADPAVYDTVRSSIARPGSTATVLGKGGLLDTGIGIIEDLQSGGVAGLIGAAGKSYALYETLKDKEIRSIVKETAKNEVDASAKAILAGTAPGAVRAAIGSPGQRGLLDGIIFPTPSTTDPRLPAPSTTEVLTQAQRNAIIARGRTSIIARTPG
jgi:hypothetical protein